MLLSTLFLIILPLLATANFDEGYKLTFTNNSPHRTLLTRNYLGFTCWLDCSLRATVMCFYIGRKDVGNAARPSNFQLDPVVDKSCQQFTTNSYQSVIPAGAYNYDRGHMVAANHMDHNTTTIWESMHMTNIMPQTSILNQQAYLRAEDIHECWRDIVRVKSIVGIVMGNNPNNNHFVNSHGVQTPDWYWRIIKKETDVDRDGDTIIAWLFPNDNSATNAALDSFITTISVIEQRTGFIFTQFTSAEKAKKPTKSWAIPANCDKSKLQFLRDLNKLA